MKWIEVRNQGPLVGSVDIPGSKNSSLALLAAACLGEEPVVLRGIPNILDFRVIEKIADEIGIVMKRSLCGKVTINSSKMYHAQLNKQLTSEFRASYYFVGALLSKMKKVTIGYPGGDNFTSRPIDQHVKALEALGAKFEFHDHFYIVEAKKLKGARIHFDTITSGATINTLLAAVLAEGTTELFNAAKDPEVIDTANMLNLMGAKIVGAGSDTIRIYGVKELGGCSYTAIPDRLIAGAFLMAAGITKGKVTVNCVIPKHMASCLSKLEEIGIGLEIGINTVTAYGDLPLQSTRVRTGMFPAFATDLQQPLTALLLQTPGHSIITEKVYAHRFNHVPQLKRMGAKIDVRRGSAFIHGGHPLQGNYVHASDVRAGTALILAGLAAEGVTHISGVEHIERGYENVIDLFRQLGADLMYQEGEYAVDEVTNGLGFASAGVI